MDDWDLDAELAEEEDLNYTAQVDDAEEEQWFQEEQEKQHGQSAAPEQGTSYERNMGTESKLQDLATEEMDVESGAVPAGSNTIPTLSHESSDDEEDEEKAAREAEAKLPYFERRKRRIAGREYLAKRSGTSRAAMTDVVSNYLFRRPGHVLGGDLSVTLASGEMRYLNIDTKKDPYHSNFKNATELGDRGSGCLGLDEEDDTLLERPVSELLAILDDQERKELLEKAKIEFQKRKLNNDAAAAYDNDESDLLDEDVSSGKSEQSQTKFLQTPLKIRKSKQNVEMQGHNQLLVDRYAPKRYIDLVSNERQSRNVLNWVLAWDQFVFGKDTKPKQSEYVSSKPARGQKNRPRPFQKLILLTGPPGAGKTTLARIIARKCGYNPVEINASDERTGPQLEARVVAAMETQSMFGNTKPNCIILDEFEGVANMGEASGFVPILAKMAEAQIGGSLTTGDGNDDNEGKKEDEAAVQKRKKKQIQPITRPIILICNDAYAPVLRPIRAQSFVVRFFPSAKNRIVSRLTHVCRHEGIRPDPGALEVLCDLSDNDIRGCLNALQFATNERTTTQEADTGNGSSSSPTRGVAATTSTPLGKIRGGASPAGKSPGSAAKSPSAHSHLPVIPLTTAGVRSICSGQRDKSTDLFKTWEEIFQLSRKGALAGRGTDRSKSKADLAFEAQVAVVEMLFKHTSEFPMVADGVFENMLELRLADSTLENHLNALEGLMEADTVSKRVLTLGEWNLSVYLPMCGLRLRSLCRADNPRDRLSFPKSTARFRRRKAETMSIIDDFQAKSRRMTGVTHKTFAAELASPLLQILSPHARSVPWNLLNPREQASVQSCVECLRDLGMTMLKSSLYSSQPQESGSESRSYFRLDPRIDMLVTFGNQNPYNRAMEPLPEPSWQLSNVINHRIMLANIHSGGVKYQGAESGIVQNQTQIKDPIAKKAAAAQPGEAMKKMQARDFFGRPIIKQSKEEKGPADPALSGGDLVETRTESEDKENSNNPAGSPEQRKRRLADPSTQTKRVIYHFKEGLTDAVRRPCYMQDFFSI